MSLLSKLNWIVVGVGDIAVRRVIPGILAEPRSNLLGVVTRSPEKAAAYGVQAWTELDQALASREVDAVYLATPVALHKPQAIACLAAGKPTVCEKPVGRTLAEADEMAKAAEHRGVPLGIAYYRRHYPKVQKAMELVLQGAIGRPVLAEISNHGWFNAEDGQRAWLLDPEMAGGGPLFDIGSHRIDLLNFFFGTPVSATGMLGNVVHRNQVEDSASVLIRYESGVQGIVDVRWHCRQGRDEFRITGTEGAISLSPLNGPLLEHPGGTLELPPHHNLHYPLIENFVEHLHTGAPLLSTATTARWTDWVTEKVLSSGSS